MYVLYFERILAVPMNACQLLSTCKQSCRYLDTKRPHGGRQKQVFLRQRSSGTRQQMKRKPGEGTQDAGKHSDWLGYSTREIGSGW